VIWDRLFGSYVDEDPHEAPRYGIVEPLHTYNPLKATFHEWASMAADFASVRGWGNKWRALFAPPAWAAAYHAQRATVPGGSSGLDAGSTVHTHSGTNDAVSKATAEPGLNPNHTAALWTSRRP
jgi:hypothetical protein